MSDTTNGGRKFWGDLSRKTGTWSAVAGLAVIAGEQAEQWLGGDPFKFEGHHWIAIIAAAVIRAIVGLVQGKVGDPSAASFAKPATAPDAPAPPLSDPPVGDPDQL